MVQLLYKNASVHELGQQEYNSIVNGLETELHLYQDNDII